VISCDRGLSRHESERLTESIGLPERDYGLDVLKALGIVLVLFYHLEPLQFSSVGDASRLSRMPSYFLSVARQESLIAVPLLVLVSLLLFCRKSLASAQYISRRLRRLSEILLVWALVQTLAWLLLSACLGPSNAAGRPQGILQVLLMGGPSLPIVGGSVFFFLADLLLLTAIAFVPVHLDARRRRLLCLGWIGASTLYFEACSVLGWTIPYWRLDGFLLYIPAAWLLATGRPSKRMICVFVLGFVGFTVHDMILRVVLDRSGNTYARNSIFFGVLSVYGIIQSLSFVRRSGVVRFLAVYSLGIFALHKYWMLIPGLTSDRIFAALHLPTAVVAHDVRFQVIGLADAAVVVALTLGSVYLASMTPLKRYVS
jgi:hypothetical protein